MKPVNEPRISYLLADGGTGANNPVECVLEEAIKLYPDADGFEVISLGSGSSNKPIIQQDIAEGGLLHWAPYITNIFMSAQTAKDHSFVSELFTPHTDSHGIPHSQFKGHYSRWSPMLSSKNTKMDNTNEMNLLTIINATDDYIDSRQSEFNTLMTRLRAPKTEWA